MKKFCIVAGCSDNGRNTQKGVSFPISDEFAEYMKTLFQAKKEMEKAGEVNEDETKGFVSSGSKRMKIYLSIVDEDGSF